ncbi:uncharacterized protein [Dysidea avara]|uniref:uncharacterized protein isoform X1 n=1 Tax=Dysidea avara TaxID=196820 RepID=UPI003323BDF6
MSKENSKGHKCPHDGCTWEFSCLSKLHRHLASHSTQKDFKCTQCERRFKTAYNVQYHVRTVHLTREKPYPCPVNGCNVHCTSTTLLHGHCREAHPDERLYSCTSPSCYSTFLHKDDLLVHQHVHKPAGNGSDAEAFTCDFCQKVLPSKSKLRRHRLFHIGEKHFRCPIKDCGHAYFTKQHLSRHLERGDHLNGGILQCPGCSRVFLQPSLLHCHSVVHCPTSFTCPFKSTSLRVCSLMEDQCCTQENEDMLGMSLSQAIQYNHTLGSEVHNMQDRVIQLYNDMTELREDLIVNVIKPLMINTVDRSLVIDYSNLDNVLQTTINAITIILSGNFSADSVNLNEALTNFFRNGISRFYFDLYFHTQHEQAVACGTHVIFSELFPLVEQDRMTVLAGNLQQIGDIFQVVQRFVMAVSTVQTALESFTLSQTCTNIWTEQYACPLCHGDATPLCLGTCNEVLIGCLSPLNQAITQLNIFKDFAVAGVQSMLTGIPLVSVNINSIRSDYVSILQTSNNYDETDLIEVVVERCPISTGKRSTDHDGHKKRQSGQANRLPDVMINSIIVTKIVNTTLPTLMNVSLASDRAYLCAFLHSNASTCTSNFDLLDVDDQANNPAGMFSTMMLRAQAGQQPYVVTDFLDMDDRNMALFTSLLPNHPIPDTSFLMETTSPSATTIPTSTVNISFLTETTGPTAASMSTSTVDDRFSVETTGPTTTSIPMPTPRRGSNGAVATSFSLFTTLVTLVLACFLC